MNDEHSVKKGLECIEQAKKFNIDVEIFKAIDGANAQNVFDKFGFTHVLKSAGAIDKLKRNGVKGCLASHLLLLEKCLNDNEPYLILEHDAFFLRSIPDDILSKFESVLHLDAFDHLSTDYYKKLKYTKKNEINYIDYLQIRPKDVLKFRALTGKEGIKHTYFYGAHAYIIKPNCVRQIFDYLKCYGLVPADWMFNNFVFPDLKGVTASIVCIHKIYNSIYVREKNLSLTNK